ncbi:MAG: 3-methyl-2-oxobutanoate hydroxymethyltransferase [Prosthecochloris sp.]|uniref:3-methyl-2-oxobutanoate hydroxymethyltransferase n=1 Tax=Prosthecochloris aestuarii (strain DSM 271 / SK 413) TaxID=290512 RepID=PANB_PROA2|nr:MULTISPECIES: 3-methyl-2-oxobutanoate hydroxymethyltransferase [Prosthecochloris]B4S8V9.1 RecName: Full=3-methyl-2-oxobutanoate hydroxymethyltransferase; AltName: Full=Ketopantoate hydroxymethyltransferase; Short=KPHMT [Prosthecochloris aestuarii DSM 271]ACF46496.1 3-methyl-2-oxobutanoate hydroxymethyltransferase [Prosthecochloris aestuarii DSM 271]MCW8798486.1 3-methyl-2-oxobutanoate hydroxymethyltransferase [Prosthecochloris sp.]NEX11820.1 3-methyl-2-oxobutanoate hydroxymethyltransferase [
MNKQSTQKLPHVTTRRLHDMKSEGEKISMLTAYDYTTARILDRAGVDVILVGDSASNVFAGHNTTLPITIDQMIYHARAVVRGVQAETSRAMVVIDMPFMSYQLSSEEALRNAGKIMKENECDAVKIEGGNVIVDTVKRITDVGIPVMGHLGLIPQSIYKFGSYKVRAREEQEAEELLRDAKLLEEAGAFALVLEKIPADLAAEVTASISIPTIGIGAGGACDGQVLVINDMLGLSTEFHPRFVRRYAELDRVIFDAVSRYVDDVRGGTFPGEDESY